MDTEIFRKAMEETETREDLIKRITNNLILLKNYTWLICPALKIFGKNHFYYLFTPFFYLFFRQLR